MSDEFGVTLPRSGGLQMSGTPAVEPQMLLTHPIEAGTPNVHAVSDDWSHWSPASVPSLQAFWAGAWQGAPTLEPVRQGQHNHQPSHPVLIGALPSGCRHSP